jgi:hypothetical protein
MYTNLARVKSTLYDFGYVKSNTNSFIATSSPTTMPTSAHIQFYIDGDGPTGNDLDHDGDGAAYDDIDDDSDGAAGNEVDNMSTKSTTMVMARNCCRH